MENKMAGNYLLMGHIAKTNGSCLYRAVKFPDSKNEPDDELWYAVKEYFDNNPEEQALEREKRLTQRIENKSARSIVIPILETVEEEGRRYAVMQYRKNGLFLSEMIHRLETEYGTGEIPVSLAIDMTEEILKTLGALHALDGNNGYVHLDIHPGNLFFESVDLKNGEIGKVKLIDFYSARPLKDGKAVIENDMPVRTVNDYSAPEQIEGEERKICAATDLYAVAAIFHRLVYGDNPDHAGINSLLDEALKKFFRCAMNYNPYYRYADAKAMLKGLEQLKKLVQEMENLHYYEFLSIAYEMFVKDIPEKVGNIPYEKKCFAESVEKLKSALVQNSVDTPQCEYIFTALWAIAENIWDDSELEPGTKNSLICSGIACSNNTGDSRRALDLFEKLQETGSYMNVLDYMTIVNRIAVTYAENDRIEEACEWIDKNIAGLEIIQNAYKEAAAVNGMDSGKIPGLTALGRAYSAKGTFLVMQHQTGSLQFYEKALEAFADDRGNRSITISHILNYACEQKDDSLYRKYYNAYFTDMNLKEENAIPKSREQCLEWILEEKFEEVYYHLYVFLKGIYVFEDVISADLSEMITKLLYNEKLKKDFHPVQLIHKYIGLILYKQSGFVDAKINDALYQSMTCIPEAVIDLNQEPGILQCITYQTMAIYNDLTGQEKENEELTEIFKEHCTRFERNNIVQSVNAGRKLSELLCHQYA